MDTQSRTPWSLVGLLVASGVVAAFQIGKVPPSLPSIIGDFGASLSQAGWLLSLVSLTSALGGMAIALSVDRVGHRRLVVIGTALFAATGLLGAFSNSIDLLLVWRFLEGLGLIAVTVSVPTLVLQVAAPADRQRAMTIWSGYMPAGVGSMLLLASIILPGTSWRAVWLVTAGLSALMLVVLLLRAVPRHELDARPANRRPILREMAEVATSGGPLAIALCFGAYNCCWMAIVGFLPTLQVDRLGFSPSTAAIVTAAVAAANIIGNLAAGWLLLRGLPRGAIIAGASISMAFCAVGIFVDGVPDLWRLVLAGIYSAVIGVVPGALFAGLAVHSPRPELVGASTGLLLQGSNLGGLVGPPIAGAMVAAGGWPAAAWLTSAALGVVAACGVFLQWREKRRITE